MKNLHKDTYELIEALLNDNLTRARDGLLNASRYVNCDKPSDGFRQAVQSFKLAEAALDDFISTCGDD